MVNGSKTLHRAPFNGWINKLLACIWPLLVFVCAVLLRARFYVSDPRTWSLSRAKREREGARKTRANIHLSDRHDICWFRNGTNRLLRSQQFSNVIELITFTPYSYWACAHFIVRVARARRATQRNLYVNKTDGGGECGISMKWSELCEHRKTLNHRPHKYTHIRQGDPQKWLTKDTNVQLHIVLYSIWRIRLASIVSKEMRFPFIFFLSDFVHSLFLTFNGIITIIQLCGNDGQSLAYFRSIQYKFCPSSIRIQFLVS